MKTTIRSTCCRARRSGALILVLFIFIPMAFLAAYLAWKVFTWKPRIDLNHGIEDPEKDAEVQRLIAEYGAEATVYSPALGITLPIDSLAYEWNETIQTSTNLTDWTDIEIEWDEALDMIQTNHTEACRFYRRMLWFE